MGHWERWFMWHQKSYLLIKIRQKDQSQTEQHKQSPESIYVMFFSGQCWRFLGQFTHTSANVHSFPPFVNSWDWNDRECIKFFFFLTCTFHFIKVAFFRAFNCILRFSFVALLSFTDQTSFICISGNYVNKKTIENNNARKWITFPNFPTWLCFYHIDTSLLIIYWNYWAPSCISCLYY